MPAKNLEIKIIDLGEKYKEWVKIIICQPFLFEYDFERDINDLWYLKYTKTKEIYKLFLKNILASYNNVDFVVFPELCMRKEFESWLKKFARENNIIIIAGSYYSNKVNTCPIITPEGIYYTEKIILSPYEIDKAKAGSNILFFKNTRCGSFCVLICSDYLRSILKKPNPRLDVLKLCPDIIFVIASTPVPERHYKRIQCDLEDCEYDLKNVGCYYVFCNSVIFNNKSRKLFASGGSSVFAISYKDEMVKNKYDYHIIKADNDSADVIIVDLNMKMKRPIVPRSVDIPPNVRYSRLELISTDLVKTITTLNLTPDFGRDLVIIFVLIYSIINKIKNIEYINYLINNLYEQIKDIDNQNGIARKLCNLLGLTVRTSDIPKDIIKSKIFEELLNNRPVIICPYEEIDIFELNPKLIIGMEKDKYITFDINKINMYEKIDKSRAIKEAVIQLIENWGGKNGKLEEPSVRKN